MIPMITTRLFSSRATSADASMRGVTSRCTGLIPSTSIASISSRIVREPRSAHIAVAPAPATINTVTNGPIWVTAPKAAPAPLKSAAPSSRNRMLSVKLTNTVRGIATNNAGNSDTRATNQDCSKNSRHWNGRRKMNKIASADIAKNPPMAWAGLEPRPSEMPGDHRSGPVALVAIGPRSLQYRHRRHRGGPTDVVRQGNPRIVNLVHGFAAQLGEQLD